MAAAANTDITQLIANAAAQYGVDPNLAIAVAVQESALNQNARSPVGAIGVFQLMPATAAGLGVDPTNLQQNIDGGVRYLSQMLALFGGNVAEALGAYNWGPGNVQNAISTYGDAWLDNAPAETQNYVANITGGQQSFTAAITPVSVATGATQMVTGAASAAAQFLSGLTPLQIGLLAGGALLAWYLVQDLFD